MSRGMLLCMWSQCSHCGEPLRRGATFCRECGSDASTGWDDDAEGLVEDSAMDEAEYQEFLSREFPESAAPEPGPLFKPRRFVMGILLLAFLLWALPEVVRWLL